MNTLRITAAACVLILGCTSGNTTTIAALEPLEQTIALGLARSDQPTTFTVTVAKPILPVSTATLAETPTGPFAPVPGELPADAPSGLDFRLKVMFTPPAPTAAVHEGTVRLRFALQDSDLRMDVIVHLSAQTEVATVQLVTPTVNFGTVATGERVRRGVELSNPSAVTPVTIESVSALPAGFAFAFDPVFPMILPPASRRSIWMQYAPEAPGTDEFDLDLDTSVAPLAASVRAEAIAEEVIVDFGDVPVDPATGETGALAIPVSSHAVSLMIQVRAGPGELLGVKELTGPQGKVYTEDYVNGPYVWSPVYWQGGPPPVEEMNVQLPNNDDPDAQLVPGGGSYAVTLAATSPTVQVQVIVKRRGRAEAAEGTLALNVFLATGTTPTAASAPTDIKLQHILSGIDAIFAGVGLRVGDVAYYDVTDPTLHDLPDDADFRALLAHSSAATASRLNLFFVHSIGGGDIPAGVVGISGALPGAKRNGTSRSGVAATYTNIPTDLVAYVSAHEIGHYLGLFHTVEADGEHDFIGDTAECPSNGVTTSACPTPGNGYLMNWVLLWPAPPVLTPGEAHVMLGHPTVSAGVPPREATLSSLASIEFAALELGPPAGWCAHCRRGP